MPIDQIYRDGKHYDQLFPAGKERPQFWIDQAHLYGGPVLELACGTGRIAIPLVQEGFEVVGIDTSEPMLAEASQKAERAQTHLEIHHADMSNFDLEKNFSLILLSNNALCHLLDLTSFESCMKCVKQHLQKNGKFIVEVFVPRLELLTQDPEERVLFSEYEDPNGGGHIIVTNTSTYDPKTQIKHNRTFHKIANQDKEIEGVLPMRMYFPQELDALFKYNGFTILHKYGSTNLEPFTATSQMQIFVLTHST